MTLMTLMTLMAPCRVAKRIGDGERHQSSIGQNISERPRSNMPVIQY